MEARQLAGEADGVLRDLLRDGMLELAEDERLWKLFLFRPASGRATKLEHRIYTKLKTNGRLAMVTFAMHQPAPGQAARSAIARVPDLTVQALDRIIESIRVQTRTGPDEYQEIDLSQIDSLDEQLEHMRGIGTEN